MENTDVIIQPAQTIDPLPVSDPALYHTNRPKRTIPYIILTLVLLGGVAATVWYATTSHDIRSKAANTGPELSLNPPSKSVTVGETFSIGMTLNANASAVSAVELHISYNPAALQIVKFTPATILPVTLRSESHEAGEISLVVASDPSTPFHGSGILGTWTVKSLAGGQTVMTIAETTQVAVVEKDTNALEKASGSTITANAQAGTTTAPAEQKVLISTTSVPTVTHTPTSTPTPMHTQNTQPTQASFSTLNNTTTQTPTATPTPYHCNSPKNPWFCKSGTCFEMSVQFDAASQLQCGASHPLTCAAYLTKYIQTQPPCYTTEDSCLGSCRE